MYIEDFKICCIENSKMTDEMIGKVIGIKQYYWNYPHDEHKKWMQENIFNGEYHLIILGATNEIVAYLNIVKTIVDYNNIKEEVMGIGNVCVQNKMSGQGVGQLLMSVCNYYLNSFGKRAMLLCKEPLVKFYEKSGWIKYEGEVYIKNKEYKGATMFTERLDALRILTERNF